MRPLIFHFVGPIALGQYVFPFCKQLPRDLPGRLLEGIFKAIEIQASYSPLSSAVLR